jgi:type II secretory pathway predicted ATPase ExeA
MERKLFRDDRRSVERVIKKARGMPSATFFSEFFGLRERPFTLLPDPDFLYWSKAHRRAYTVLEYGVMSRAPITVVTGEVGAGKTTLVQKLLRDFDDNTVVGLISNAQGGRGDLLQWALNALDVAGDTGSDYVSKHQALQSFLIRNYAAGKRVVLIIDEAQNLSREGLEELRMMTNINAGKDELLQLILVGQPELREMISGYDMRQFAQRVMASFHLPNMDLETTEAYVRHRLIHAGGTGEEFTRGAIALIHRYSDGVPRLVNKFADFAMVYAASSDRKNVDEMTVCEVNADALFVMPGIERKDAAE